MTRLHPLGRAELAVYALAFTIGLQLVLLAHVLSATADARRRWRRDLFDAGVCIDELRRRPERVFIATAAES